MAVMSRTKLLLVCTFFAVAAAIDVGGTCANGGSCAKDGTTQTSQPSAEVPVVDTLGLIQSTHTLAKNIGVNPSVTPTDLPKDTAQKKDSPTAAKERVPDVLKKVAMPFNMHRFMELDISAHEMREMLGANFTPETAGIIQDVINTLAKHLEDNVKRDQDSAKQDVVTRLGDLTEKTNSAVAQKTEGDSADISHSTCVTEEVQLLTDHKTCTDEETKLKEEEPSLGFCGNSILQPVDYPNSPDLIELLAKDISIDYSDDLNAIKSQLDAHAAEVKLEVDAWVAEMKLIATTKKNEWTIANQKCIDKTKELADKTKECGEKVAAWQLQHQKCLHEKSAQQLAVCGFGYKYQFKCGSKTEYDNTRAGITGTGTDLSEPDREKEWTHFTRMMCVLETFKTTIELDSSAVDACTKSDDEAAADFTADVGRIDLQEDVYGELTSEAKFTCTETHITFGNGDLWTVPENTNDVAEWLPTADEYTKETGYAYAIKPDVSNPPFDFCMGSGDHPTAPTCGSAFDCSAGSGSAKPATTPCHLDTGCTSADCCQDMFSSVDLPVPTNYLNFAGCSMADRVGNMDASMVGGVSCLSGEGLVLDGQAGTQVNLAGVEFGGPTTIALWAKFDSNPGNYARLFLFSEPNDAAQIMVEGWVNGVLRVKALPGASGFNGHLDTPQTSIRVGEMAHYVLVLHGSAIELYINGDLIASNNQGIEPTQRMWPHMYLGSTGTGNNFDGTIESVGIWSIALSSNQVSRLYQTHWEPEAPTSPPVTQKFGIPANAGSFKYFSTYETSGDYLTDSRVGENCDAWAYVGGEERITTNQGENYYHTQIAVTAGAAFHVEFHFCQPVSIDVVKIGVPNIHHQIIGGKLQFWAGDGWVDAATGTEFNQKAWRPHWRWDAHALQIVYDSSGSSSRWRIKDYRTVGVQHISGLDVTYHLV